MGIEPSDIFLPMLFGASDAWFQQYEVATGRSLAWGSQQYDRAACNCFPVINRQTLYMICPVCILSPRTQILRLTVLCAMQGGTRGWIAAISGG